MYDDERQISKPRIEESGRTEEATDLVGGHESEGKLLGILESDLPQRVSLRVVPKKQVN